MNKLLFATAAVGALSLSACKQEGTSISNNQTQGMTDEAMVDNSANAAGNLGEAATASADQTYVQNAAASDLLEIESSKLALDKATRRRQDLCADDDRRAWQVDYRAQGRCRAGGHPGADDASARTADQARPASRQKWADFDAAYLGDQRAGHQDTLAKVNAYLAAAPAGPLKDHAAKVTGVVQKHLNSLEKIK